MNDTVVGKPFLKWAGGKGQLISSLELFLPSNIKSREFVYIEPFVGGGAMLFHMLQRYPKIKKAIINDITPSLTIAYQVVRDNTEALIKNLISLQQDYFKLENEAKRKEFFLVQRDKFNLENLSDIERTTLLIFLNKTCFNGLFRLNSKGHFNVPFGKYSNPRICDPETLMADSKLLQKVQILNGDFSQVAKYIDVSTFVYLDPPYRPLSSTSNFNSYSKEVFNDDEQRRLKIFCDLLEQKKCQFMLSNSDSVLGNCEKSFFDELYSNYNRHRVLASRSINSKASKRGKLTELVITDYQTTENMDMSDNFSSFMSQLKETNATLDFFCDFKKINTNVEQVSIKLNQLNYLIGKEDIGSAVHELWLENKSAFNVLDILIAVRRDDAKKAINKNGQVQLIKEYFNTEDSVVEFITETGLVEVFKKKEIKNLVDYVFGVETGLDTNARKNRSGHLMENRVASLFNGSSIPFKQEVNSTDYEQLNILGVDKKRFDFVIETQKKNYLIEVNFFSSGGSKLNEVARAYSELAPKINELSNFEFVWITDGVGWKSARGKLEEAFKIIPKVYNLKIS